MKLKRTLPSVTNKNVRKNVIMNSESSEDQNPKPNVLSHVQRRNTMHKIQDEMIVSKILNSKRAIFQRGNQQGNPSSKSENDHVIQKNMVATFAKNDDKKSIKADKMEKNKSKASLFRSSIQSRQLDLDQPQINVKEQEPKVEDQKQIKRKSSFINKIESQENSNLEVSKSRRRSIFNNKQKTYNQQEKSESKSQSRQKSEKKSPKKINKKQQNIPAEHVMKLIDKIHQLESTVKVLSTQIQTQQQGTERSSELSRRSNTSSSKFKDYRQQVPRQNNHFNNIYQNGYETQKRSSVRKLEMQQMRRCQKLAEQNQLLYSRLRNQSTISNQYDRNDSRKPTLKFQDFNIYDEDRSYHKNYSYKQSYQNSRKTITWNQFQQDDPQQICSPFSINQNNRYSTYSLHDLGSSPYNNYPTNFNNYHHNNSYNQTRRK